MSKRASVTYSKCCLVPLCTNTSKNNPNKLFVNLPNEQDRRKQWLNAMKRRDISKERNEYVCEDHFNLEKDMENYNSFKLNGGEIFLKKHVHPNIFDCQNKRKRTKVEGGTSLKRTKKLKEDEEMPIDIDPLDIDLLEKDPLGLDPLGSSIDAKQKIPMDISSNDSDSSELTLLEDNSSTEEDLAPKFAIKIESDSEEEPSQFDIKNHSEFDSTGIDGDGGSNEGEMVEDSDTNCKDDEYLSPELVEENGMNSSSECLKENKCRYCDYTSSVKDDLADHISTSHFNPKNYACSQCDFKGSKPSRLKQHIEAVHLKLKDFKCKLCDFSTSRASMLKRHVDVVHYKIKKKKCKYCDYKGSDLTKIRIHMERMHSKLKSEKCTLCDFISKDAQSVKNHLNEIHCIKMLDNQECVNIETNGNKCPFCNVTNDKPYRLKKHIKVVHYNMKNFGCTLCSYKADKPAVVKQHVDTVHFKRRKRHRCKQCNFESSKLQVLEQHLKDNRHERKVTVHKCESCDVKTFKASALTRHIDTVHRKIKKHTCNQCDFSSRDNYGLERHIDNVHNKVKRFKCDQCDYVGRDASAVRHHTVKEH